MEDERILPTPEAPNRIGPPRSSYLLGGDQGLRLAASEVYEELSKSPTPTDFHELAAEELLKVNAEFLRDVGVESVRIARKHRMDSVSREHVREAAGKLSAPPHSAVNNVLITLGGLACGAGLSGIFEIVTKDGALERSIVLFTLSLLLVGLPMLVIGLIPRSK